MFTNTSLANVYTLLTNVYAPFGNVDAVFTNLDTLFMNLNAPCAFVKVAFTLICAPLASTFTVIVEA